MEQKTSANNAAVSRKASATIRSPYTGASDKTSLLDWFASSGDADTDTLSALDTLRTRSRDLARNAPAATGTLKTMTDGVIGSGLRFQCAIDKGFIDISDEEAIQWQEKTELEFKLWSESAECDFSRRLDFGGLQYLAFKEKFCGGDCFVLLPYVQRPMMPYDLRIQLIEAERITNHNDLPDTDKIRGGIEYSENGVPLAVHIRSIHPGTIYLSFNNYRPVWKRVPFYGPATGRRNVLHLMKANRIGQSRGVPAFAPIIDTLKQISKYNEAELQAAVVNAMLSVFIKRPTGDVIATGANMDFYHDENGNPVTPPWERENNYKLGNGTWIDGAPGEELQIVNASRPSPQYDPFFLSNIKQIGMGVGIPFEILIKHFSSSYSASRAAMLDFFKTVLIERKNFDKDFCQPIYKEWLTEAVIKGYVQAPGYLSNPRVRFAYSGAYFIGETMGSIDPVKEVTASNMLVEYGFSTKQVEASKLTGMDYKDIARAQADEKRIAESFNLPYGKENSEDSI
ncbi:MAG: phage portal protein [Chitinivibrionia bacterium]|nr:phage portal protein [Chitinivibrionia bacterium]